jgi:hypothetical protein
LNNGEATLFGSGGRKVNACLPSYANTNEGATLGRNATHGATAKARDRIPSGQCEAGTPTNVVPSPFGGKQVRCSNYSRSASPLSHAERLGALALRALVLYPSRSEGVTRTFIRTLAGSLTGGLPLGRLGLSMGLIMDSQIILDKPPVRVLNVLTLNTEVQMKTAYYTPVKMADIFVTAHGVTDLHQADIEERAPVCGMTREAAIAYAKAAYGDYAGIENDETRDVEDV